MTVFGRDEVGLNKFVLDERLLLAGINVALSPLESFSNEAISTNLLSILA